MERSGTAVTKGGPQARGPVGNGGLGVRQEKPGALE